MDVTSWEEQHHTSLKTVVNVQTTSGGMVNQDDSSSTALTQGQFSKIFRVVVLKNSGGTYDRRGKERREVGGRSRDAKEEWTTER
jgi:hypothetical protein